MMLREREEIARAIRDEGYQGRVSEALDDALARAEEERLDLARGRCIIFSDQHRGTRNRADDFRRSERAYNTALARYFRMGYTLIVLGDAEELWEERPAPVLEMYEHSLALEAEFHKKGRYLRFWGNHDDEWRTERSTKSHLQPLFGDLELKVRECLKIPVVEDGQELGRLFLVHGHQGTDASDRWSRYSRLVVRYIWRPFQRATGYSPNTPAKDWVLREKHNIAMYTWAAEQTKLVLIAGHTHRPVFESQSHSAQIKERLDVVETQLEAIEVQIAATPDDEELRKLAGELREEVGDLAAELEWVRAQEDQKPGLEGGLEGITPMTKPCYFNTGCCCFADGDITGIEIDRGEIRLVRWPNDEEQPRPRYLAEASLRNVFARC